MKLYTKHELDAMNVTTLKEIAAQINLDGRSKITKATRDYYTEKMVAVFDGMRAEELRVVEKLEGKEWEALRDRVQEALKNGEKMPEVSLANEFPTYKRSLIIAAVKSARNFCNAHGTASQIFIVENYGEEADLKAVAGDMSNALGINWKTCMAAIKVRLGEIGSEIFAGYEKMAKEGVTSRDLDLKPHEVAKRIADAYLAPGRFRMLVKAVADRMDKMREAKTTMTTMAAKTPEQIRQENDEALKAAKLRENAKKSRVAEIFFAVKRGSDYEVHENGKSVSARVARRKEVLAAKQA